MARRLAWPAACLISRPADAVGLVSRRRRRARRWPGPSNMRWRIGAPPLDDRHGDRCLCGSRVQHETSAAAGCATAPAPYQGRPPNYWMNLTDLESCVIGLHCTGCHIRFFLRA
ncbi:hypothetical protein PAHAL_7G122000 [Panicum hallii]|uniref:Uncharacterized protein n=1 Tax=Panicum hallii TaxID=206008 RepID=A0A2T8IC18_9POAL|nr:hypothetical protein PAHAL_7G122000 [Panicum hallii]